MLKKSKCSKCRRLYIVETDSDNTCRIDRKRIYPAQESVPKQIGICCFLCKCGALIHESVKDAEFGRIL